MKIKGRLIIIIPAFNEADCIMETIRDITKTLQGKIDYKIVVVDDGSTDKTTSLIESSNISNVNVIKEKKNRGKGFAVKKGILSSSGNYYLFMDADNSTRIRHFFDFYPHLKKYSIIIGSRGLKNSVITKRQSFFKNLLGGISAILINKVLGLSYKDTQCGFKLFRRDVAREIFREVERERWSFDFEILRIAKKKNINVLELPIIWKNRKESRVFFLDYFRTLKDLFIVAKKHR